ncbi:response regulator transcription factor [Sulfurospirillum multivorans]|uniref:Two-component response regulator n=2 Tax=Sulfurospirillum multivorans TaxID=66821 RepID=A0AA86AMK6_SULMK|nr:response regulator transcription factor [Sulfurospirillum multivorans]AHJ13426.1 putative two-component response regulator [Sulfurospirillum multivorans DSM 12446]QEH06917.1 putative two-component response regulator [Sulfurospirillum multivorans]
MNKDVLKLLKQLNVLLVEDDPFLGQTIFDALNPYCGHVTLDCDGEAGLDSFFQGTFNVVITDINLPKKTGISLAGEIRRSNKEIIIIILTAHDTEHNIHSAIDIGVFAFLHKPFQLEQLYNTLLMSLSKIQADHKLLNLGKNHIYNVKTKEIFCGDEMIRLTRTESLLLQILVSNMGQVITFDSIERSVWYEKQATPDTIRMYINKLRAKLYYELIENVQGYGYKLVPNI